MIAPKFNTTSRVYHVEDGGLGTVMNVRLDDSGNETYQVMYDVRWDDDQDNGEYLGSQLQHVGQGPDRKDAPLGQGHRTGF